MLEKKTIGEVINVTPEGVIEYKIIEAVFEDGIELFQRPWRTTYDPLTNVLDFEEGSRLRRVMEAVWTPTLKEEWRAKIAAENAQTEVEEGK